MYTQQYNGEHMYAPGDVHRGPSVYAYVCIFVHICGRGEGEGAAAACTVVGAEGRDDTASGHTYLAGAEAVSSLPSGPGCTAVHRICCQLYYLPSPPALIPHPRHLTLGSGYTISCRPGSPPSAPAVGPLLTKSDPPPAAATGPSPTPAAATPREAGCRSPRMVDGSRGGPPECPAATPPREAGGRSSSTVDGARGGPPECPAAATLQEGCRSSDGVRGGPPKCPAAAIPQEGCRRSSDGARGGSGSPQGEAEGPPGTAWGAVKEAAASGCVPSRPAGGWGAGGGCGRSPAAGRRRVDAGIRLPPPYLALLRAMLR